MTNEFSVRITKITSRIGVSWTHSLPFWLWPLFNSMKSPYYQTILSKGSNQIHLLYITLWNLPLPIFKVFVQILLDVNLFLNQTLLTFFLYVRQHVILMLWNKHKYQHPADVFVKNIFNPFYDTGPFLYYLKCIRNQRFLDVFRGEHWKRPMPLMG